MKLSESKTRPKTFLFNGEKYSCFWHSYNLTNKNERQIEVPIVYQEVLIHLVEDVFELGCVLPHYFPTSHTVVDLEDTHPGTINEDILQYNTERKFGLIVSISTIEHLEGKDLLTAFLKLKSMLKPGGKVLFTVPLGFNDELDRGLREKWLLPHEIYCFHRESPHEDWYQLSWSKMLELPWDHYKSGIALDGVQRTLRSVSSFVLGVIQEDSNARRWRAEYVEASGDIGALSREIGVNS